ncbi:MAG: hypothetical protein HRU18_23480 [Pseudoalteromonas sp.]|uniref:hypothetical protein n=1 Tax=Pseudoalteromonas sp. TaxID=53249 RepID=UPI001D3F05EB|nr:hypothetical protein [Pseudoalteromonas sp.]NRA81173.1 hypothetical protein [Pseudoalteromonas sp.]
MRYLLAGMESAERVNLLLSLTKINSEGKIKGIHLILVDGKSEVSASVLSGILQQNLNDAISTLEEVASKVEAIKNLDWEKFESLNYKVKETACQY